MSKNIIYYGPPGTGKTYMLQQLLKRDYERGTAVLSNDEWRQQFIADNFSQLKWWEIAAAALYEIGKFAQGSAVQLFDNASLYAVDGGTIRLPSLSNWQPPSATFTSNTSETVCLADQPDICKTPVPTVPLNINPGFVMDQANEGAANLNNTPLS